MKHLLFAIGLVTVLAASKAALSLNVSVRDELGKLGLQTGQIGNWLEEKDVLGLPYVFIEPEKTATSHEQRPFRANISITPIGTTSTQPPMSYFKQTETEYQTARIDYLGERAGTLIRFLDVKHLQRDPKTRVHEFGVEYEIGGIAFHEESHYVFCIKSGDMFIVKGVSALRDSSQAAMKEILKTFRCRS